MKQGILINGRTKILFRKKGSVFRPKRTGHRKRKSVRGCILGPDLAVIGLRIVKKGDKEETLLVSGSRDKTLMTWNLK